MKTVVIGSGSWGTALAQVLVDNGQDCIIWGKNYEEVNEIQNEHTIKKFFPDVQLNPQLQATADLSVVKDADVVLLSVPSIAIEEVCQSILPYLTKKIIVVNTAKGFHPGNNDRMSNVIRDCIPSDKLSSVVSLIGPSHAEEVVLRMLTTICAVSLNEADAMTIQHLFSNNYFRVYRGNDELGSELGVAVKNAIALASGVLAGLGYGDNTKAALITRGLAEMIRFGTAMGGRQETFMGLTGIGDLVVTCTSVHSRNFQAGYQIGKADDAQVFWQNNTKTVEGVRTAKVLYELKEQHQIDMPIVDEIYKVLYEGKKPSVSARDLMLRELKAEL
ncbi:NAD(P)H-dependent glycerol-3-phosphate dehydrogenase [Dielma fastidiosa]|uniref:NAD(P)H-dependent glycerol-3-phosphate dehydrogenase n=1 Tax=Dielma fastidiosa TaxID=1034346 RepID=UPI0023EFD9BC|nr:NAD(P)H-dependent glycerol-3-phosphate dehydrogenase [Dielma fastidiosa]